MDTALAFNIIESTSKECDYTILKKTQKTLEISLSREQHTVIHFIEVYNNDWIKVSFNATGDKSVAMYSLRSITDVILYTQTLITAYDIRSKRQE